MSFQQGLSGLSAASTNLDVIGNNISNANTPGYKQSQAQFTDIFASSLDGAGSSKTQVGIGSRVSAVAQIFNQGNISPTNNPLDIAINGQGFFRMSEGGVVSYSRNGQFRLDGNGFLTDSNAANLTGYLADAKGDIVASQPANLKLNTTDIPPQVTSTFTMGMNLNSGETVPTVTPFDANNPKSYTSTTSGTIIDSLGNAHLFSIFFEKTATAGTWNAYATVDGEASATGVPIGVTLDGAASKALVFDNNGALTAPIAPFNVSVDLATIDASLSAASPLVFSLDLTTATQFGSKFGVNSISQDGYTSGRLAGFTTSPDGLIQGSYSNGQTRSLGQIVLANFVNPQGLNPVGNGRWIETPSSGQPLVGPPKTGTLGALQASAVEDANVDLTSELVKMITAQRMYQANAKSIETQDAVLQTLVNL
ncbi:flagellar hook protein FlgE [Nitrosomonas sp.]|uniref:flagellar hook protein FlgE n=1 Tax=Nitrosomonas sp. TaxID=42353 RepID=UPI002716216A|nr:flagellar hook protein FlgE [Nitrosomonas sp.]MDO8893993.1 flagellar hook protein FlgE [Nitrosomonas sp.]MDP1788626.1 flagellar hook protein FlgE [Nitrosomonas sp.]MDP2223884.1 flagellar hook protein FlgE [Nitrosomonas sp.]